VVERKVGITGEAKEQNNVSFEGEAFKDFCIP
jgi:hypothetical protein